MPTDKISSEALLREDEDGYDEGSVNGSIGENIEEDRRHFIYDLEME